MAGYNKLLKRKGVDLDNVSDGLDLSDIPLSSPATKIRRLDAAEFPPIAEGVEVEQDEPLPTIAATPIAATQELEAAPTPAPAPNEERALVLFKPLLHSSSSPFSLTLTPDLLSQFKKDQAPWSKHGDSDCDRLLTTAAEREEEQQKKNRGMALVPWVPSSSTQFPILQDSNNTDLMEADDESDAAAAAAAAEGSMMMDVEQQDTTINPQTSTIYPAASTLHLSHGGIAAAETSAPEGLHHQWQQQQQHCLLPQIPQRTSTPITWTR